MMLSLRSESVISGKGELKALCADIDQRCVTLLLLQAPVATDLWLVVAAIHAVGDLKRMGDLAGHIAKITRMKQLAARFQARFARSSRRWACCGLSWLSGCVL
jgi:phosphate transport system protein